MNFLDSLNNTLGQYDGLIQAHQSLTQQRMAESIATGNSDAKKAAQQAQEKQEKANRKQLAQIKAQTREQRKQTEMMRKQHEREQESRALEESSKRQAAEFRKLMALSEQILERFIQST